VSRRRIKIHRAKIDYRTQTKEAPTGLVTAQERFHHGNFAAAAALCRKLLAVDPHHAGVLHLSGLIAHRYGDAESAISLIGRALQEEPQSPEMHYNLGVVLVGKGQLIEAALAFTDAVELNPGYVDAWFNLGRACKDLGCVSRAVQAFAKAASLRPQDAKVHYNLGNACAAMRALPEAIDAFTTAIACQTDFKDALRNLAQVLLRAARAEDAVRILNRLLEIDPAYPKIHLLLGCALVDDHRPEEAFAQFLAAIDADSADALAYSNLASVAIRVGRFDIATAVSKAALELDPDLAEAYGTLNCALRKQGAITSSIAAAKKALELQPSLSAVYDNLALALADRGQVREAIAWMVRSVVLTHGRASTVSNLCFLLQYLSHPVLLQPEMDAALLRRFHEHWAAIQNSEGRPEPLAPTDPDPERKLKVGLLSPDLHRHPVGYFLAACLPDLDRSQFDIICYSDSRVADDLTEELKGNCTRWVETSDISDLRLTEQIRRDGVDILIDLAGHTAGNRMAVFLRRAAPVQATWAGYVGTTGLAQMDYLIADRFHVPFGEEACYTEKVLRLPDGYICYAPPEYAPEVAILPAVENGYITFGCFNNLTKVNPEVVRAWSSILAAVPASRILLKCRQLDDPEVRAEYRRLFERQGVAAERILLEGHSAHRELLNSYARIDIGLDPFPYSGGLTTLEALWMGVPTITKTGKTFAGRHSTSHLRQVGLDSFITPTLDAYIAAAVRMAEAQPELSALRGSLRERMRQSPLCDGKRFSTHLSTALRRMWAECCSRYSAVGAPEEPVLARERRLPRDGRLRVAVITPYHKEGEDILRRCHESVRLQTYAATHFMIADGHPNQAVANWDVSHIVLSSEHRDNGNTPRAVGSAAAVKEGFDAVAYLDCDNWFLPAHIDSMVTLHQQTEAAVCTAGRSVHTIDGSPLALESRQDESNGEDFSDTSSLFLTRDAFPLIRLWALMPPEFGPYCDRVFWKAVVASGLATAHSPQPTVAFTSQYKVHYQRAGVPIPDGLKTGDDMARMLRSEVELGDNATLDRYLQTVFSRMAVDQECLL
jgi:protein O-GlcNAc transferase